MESLLPTKSADFQPFQRLQRCSVSQASIHLPLRPHTLLHVSHTRIGSHLLRFGTVCILILRTNDLPLAQELFLH